MQRKVATIKYECLASAETSTISTMLLTSLLEKYCVFCFKLLHITSTVLFSELRGWCLREKRPFAHIVLAKHASLSLVISASFVPFIKSSEPVADGKVFTSLSLSSPLLAKFGTRLEHRRCGVDENQWWIDNDVMSLMTWKIYPQSDVILHNRLNERVPVTDIERLLLSFATWWQKRYPTKTTVVSHHNH